MINNDLNYIAALEKAISEKYGDLAAINPKSLWNEEKEKQYKDTIIEINKKQATNEKTKERVNCEGVLINKKILKNQNNKTCQGCNKYCLDKKDDVFLLKYNACHKCYINYIEDRESRWLSGWRPTEK